MTIRHPDNHPEQRAPWTKADAATAVAIKALVADTERQIALAAPVEGLLPGLQLRFYPAVLALLGRVPDAAELAAYLARDSLLEDGREPTEAAVAALVRDRYLTDGLLAAVVQNHGAPEPQEVRT